MKIIGGIGIALFVLGASAMDSEGIGLVIAVAMMVAGMAMCTIFAGSIVDHDDEIDNLLRMEDDDKTFWNFK
jgi:hypothetical protein